MSSEVSERSSEAVDVSAHASEQSLEPPEVSSHPSENPVLKSTSRTVSLVTL